MRREEGPAGPSSQYALGLYQKEPPIAYTVSGHSGWLFEGREANHQEPCNTAAPGWWIGWMTVASGEISGLSLMGGCDGV